eukprot:scaffold4145_cov55-Attheya_sp.AAC.5
MRDEKERKRVAAISAICSAPDEAGDNDGSADEAGTLMKSIPQKRGRKDERISQHTEVGRGCVRTPLYQDSLVLKRRIIVT